MWLSDIESEFGPGAERGEVNGRTTRRWHTGRLHMTAYSLGDVDRVEIRHEYWDTGAGDPRNRVSYYRSYRRGYLAVVPFSQVTTNRLSYVKGCIDGCRPIPDVSSHFHPWIILCLSKYAYVHAVEAFTELAPLLTPIQVIDFYAKRPHSLGILREAGAPVDEALALARGFSSAPQTSAPFGIYPTVWDHLDNE